MARPVVIEAPPQKAEARSVSVWGSIGVLVGLAGILLVLTAGDSIAGMSIRQASVLLLAVGLMVYFVLCRQNRQGAWSTASMAFLVLFLFHAGLFVEISVSGSLRETFDFHSEWMVPPIAQQVIAIVIVAFLSFLVGASLPAALTSRGVFVPRVARANVSDQDDLAYRTVAARTGALLVVAGVVFWFYENVSEDGWLFFTLGYRNFFASSRELDTSVTVLPILLGLGLVAQRVRIASSGIALVFFAVYATVSLLVGARIYPMSGLVILLVVLGLRRKMPSSWWLLGGVVAALAAVSVIRSFRNDGLAAARGTALLVDPTAALAELGSTVKVVAVSYQWHDVGNESYALGLTFLNPLIRGFNTLFGRPNVEGSADPGSFVNVIASREGQIGGSIVAEAHHNWGLIGVIFTVGVWAFALSAASHMAKSSLSMSVTALILVLFLIQVRGFFGPIPALAIVGTLIVAATRLFARRRPGRPKTAPAVMP